MEQGQVHGAAPDDAPAWETVETRWSGWTEFCSSHLECARDLADGLALSKEDWLVLRGAQQPWTDPQQPHRYLPWTWEEPNCWACQGPEDADIHARWWPSADEAQPAVITVKDFARFALESASEPVEDSPRDLWLRARYHAVMQALGLDRNVLAEAMDDPEQGDHETAAALVLFAQCCRDYQGLDEDSLGSGVLEIPGSWAPIAAAHAEVRRSRDDLRQALETLAGSILAVIFDDRRHATTTTSVLWAAGIPLAEPDTRFDGLLD